MAKSSQEKISWTVSGSQFSSASLSVYESPSGQGHEWILGNMGLPWQGLWQATVSTRYWISTGSGFWVFLLLSSWLSGGSHSKESACGPGDPGLIPGSGRSPREGHGYPVQYSCLENPMDRGAWQAIVHGVAKSQIQLSMHPCSAHTQAIVFTSEL